MEVIYMYSDREFDELIFERILKSLGLIGKKRATSKCGTLLLSAGDEKGS
jgi:hypothetical protein